ncbi:MAG TPA: SDR family NAD(P)-dependent oxidoreductase [Stellaceae bacterium]|nr:SDR family NAD(P)-dependent oxidoreductase [Stellaceae bacterium]
MQLDGKVALITGGAGVIGRAAAQRLADEGARIVLVDKDERGLTEAAAALGPARASWIAADVTRGPSVAGYARAAFDRFGPIHVFFNNAGIEGPTAPLADFPEDGFAAVMAVNVTGVFLGLKYVLPLMADGGSVIVTSSTAGLRGAAEFVAYCASKHAVIGIMRTAALEAAPRRIRVNSIHPAPVESDMIKRLERARAGNGDPAEAKRRFVRRIPLGRYVLPDEVADLVLFLASDASRMITGSMLGIDGGSLAG